MSVGGGCAMRHLHGRVWERILKVEVWKGHWGAHKESGFWRRLNVVKN